jgi:hypothetical protein
MTQKCVTICDTCHYEQDHSQLMFGSGRAMYPDGEFMGIQRHICETCQELRRHNEINKMFSKFREDLKLGLTDKPEKP